MSEAEARKSGHIIGKRRCTSCNEYFDSVCKGFVLCPACQKKLGVEMRQRTPERDFPADWSFDDKVDKAREMDLSYGNFVALVHDGTLNIKELTKPEPKHRTSKAKYRLPRNMRRV